MPQVGETSIKSFPNSIHGLEVFSELKNLDHQLASALSTMLKLRLVVFLHFDKHAVENAQKAMLCMIPICQFGFLTPNVDFIRNKKAV